MKQKTERNIKKNLANFFGSFGYLVCSLQWSWAILLYFSVIQSTVSFIAPHTITQSEQPHSLTFTPPGQFEMIILAIFAALMVILTIYIIIKTPIGIVKASSKVVHQTAETMIPIVMKVQHKKETKKFYAEMTAKLILIMKLLVIIAPVALAAGSGLLEKQSIDYSIAMIASWGLASGSIAFFAIQYTLAGVFRVKLSELW